MAIAYHPPVGSIILCDYGRGGFIEPEMVKRRPVAVLSPRLPRRAKLVTVVPLSASPPRHRVPYAVQLDFAAPIDPHFCALTMWAKCDMVAAVCFDRLDLFRDGRDASGKRLYKKAQMTPDQLAAVKLGVLAGLGMKD